MKQAILIVFLATFGLEGAYYFLVGLPDLSNPDPKAAIPYFIWCLVVTWIPGIAALVFAKKEGMKLRVFQKPDWMILFAGLCAIGICCAGLALSIPFNQWREAEGAQLIGLAIGALATLVSGFTMMPFIVLGEELFWRGYLHEKLKSLGMLKASLIIGTIWGVWHVPMILMGHNYPNAPIIGPLFMILMCIAASPLFFWFRERGKSILIPAVLHAMINSFAGISFFVFQQPNPLLTEQGLPGLFVFASLSTFLVLRDRGKRLSESI